MSVIDDYLEGLDPPRREALARVCRIVRGAVPEAEEAHSYGMPAFTYRGRPLLGFRASQRHLSVHPFSPASIDTVRDALGGYDVSKGTIRFTPEQPLAESTLRRLIEARRREIAGS